MKGLSIVIEVHAWRGIGASYDLFLLYLRLGWVTIGASRWVISDRLCTLQANLRVLAKDRKP